MVSGHRLYSSRYRSNSVPCEKRVQLAKVFLSAAIEVEKVGGETEELPNVLMNIAEQLRDNCMRSLSALNAHRKEHGC
jgi:hypothetical protein